MFTCLLKTRSVIARGRFNLDVYFYLKKSKEAGFDAVDFWQYKDYGIFHTMDPELAIDDLIEIKRQKSNINT